MDYKLLILILTLPFISGCWTIEDGEKIGYLTTVSDTGLFFKTTNCVLIRGGLNDGSGVIGGSTTFIIESKSVINKANNVMLKEKQVKVKYHKELITMPCRTGTNGYFLDDIEIID